MRKFFKKSFHLPETVRVVSPTTTPMESTLITEPMRQITLQAIRQKGITKAQIAEAVGKGRSWPTKFLDGTFKTISDDSMVKIEELLGIRFFQVVESTATKSPLAEKIAARVDADPLFAKMLGTMDEVFSQARGAFTPKFIPTQDMTKIGQEIIKIAFANEDKPGKVARLVLEILA